MAEGLEPPALHTPPWTHEFQKLCACVPFAIRMESQVFNVKPERVRCSPHRVYGLIFFSACIFLQ